MGYCGIGEAGRGGMARAPPGCRPALRPRRSTCSRGRRDSSSIARSVRGPAMVDVMARLLSTQATAQCTRLAPRASACALSFSAIIRLSGRHSASIMRLSWRAGAAAGLGHLVDLVLAGQHAARDRAVGHDAEAERLRRRQQLDLGLAVHQVVVGLQRRRRRHAELPAQMHDVRDVPGAHVGEPPFADLALADQVAEGWQWSAPRPCVDRRPVDVVEVDVIGLQPLQAGLHGAHHVAAR